MSAATPKLFSDAELLYSATARCKCGAGLAHPLDHDLSVLFRAWVCSAVLSGRAQASPDHEMFSWSLFKVREETSINNEGGYTTRPAGTVARTVGKALCPKCGHRWESEPYSACGAGHHWYSGDCPGCGYGVGGHGSYSSDQGKPIERRYIIVVQDVASGRAGVG